MALEISTDASEAWKTIRGNAQSFKANAQAINATLTGTNVTLDYVIDVYRVVLNSKNQLDSLALTANLTSYVQDVLASPGYDVVAEIATVSAAQQVCLDWIDTNASGLSLTGDSAANAIANGSIVTNRFTPAQTSALRTNLSAVIAAING